MSKISVSKILKGKSSSSGPAKIKGDDPMPENPASRQAEGSDKSENSQITKKVKPTTTIPGSPETDPVQGYDTVKKVERKFDEDGPEAARKSNNMSRDARTNLGRGTWSVPVLD
jgi:hypothetical protein